MAMARPMALAMALAMDKAKETGSVLFSKLVNF